MLNESFELSANNNTFKLAIKEYAQPSNGREMWVTDLLINNEISNHYFDNNWNNLDFHISKVSFTDAANNYVFVPAETKMFIINTTDLKCFYLPKVDFRIGQFIGNMFLNNKLSVIFANYIIIYNLNKQQYNTYIFDAHKIMSFEKRDNIIVLTVLRKEMKRIEKQHIDLG